VFEGDGPVLFGEQVDGLDADAGASGGEIVDGDFAVAPAADRLFQAAGRGGGYG
jgi:hypothetical protein